MSLSSDSTFGDRALTHRLPQPVPQVATVKNNSERLVAGAEWKGVSPFSQQEQEMMRPPFGLRWKAWKTRNKRTIVGIILALLATALIFWLQTWAEYRGTTKWYQEEIQRLQEENQLLKDERQKEEDWKKEIRDKVVTFCASSRNPPICEGIAEAGIRTELATGLTGFNRFLLAVSANESLFLPQHIPYHNSIGAGWCDSCESGVRFESWQDEANWLASWLLKRGIVEITPEAIKEINHRYGYASSKVWWQSIVFFMEKINA